MSEQLLRTRLPADTREILIEPESFPANPGRFRIHADLESAFVKVM